MSESMVCDHFKTCLLPSCPAFFNRPEEIYKCHSFLNVNTTSIIVQENGYERFNPHVLIKQIQRVREMVQPKVLI